MSSPLAIVIDVFKTRIVGETIVPGCRDGREKEGSQEERCVIRGGDIGSRR